MLYGIGLHFPISFDLANLLKLMIGQLVKPEAKSNINV